MGARGLFLAASERIGTKYPLAPRDIKNVGVLLPRTAHVDPNLVLVRPPLSFHR